MRIWSSSAGVCAAAVIAVAAAGALPARAGPAADAVRVFYGPDPGGEWDPAKRDRFVDPARAQFNRNDVLSNNGQELGCLDFVLALDAQDYDEATLDRTLHLSERVDGDEAQVTARFRLFPDHQDPGRVVWDLRRVGGVWKVSDIASPDRGWRLSEFDCD